MAVRYDAYGRLIPDKKPNPMMQAAENGLRQVVSPIADEFRAGARNVGAAFAAVPKATNPVEAGAAVRDAALAPAREFVSRATIPALATGTDFVRGALGFGDAANEGVRKTVGAPAAQPKTVAQIRRENPENPSAGAASTVAPGATAAPTRTGRSMLQETYDFVTGAGLRKPDLSVPAVTYGKDNVVSVNGKEAGTFKRAGGTATTTPEEAAAGLRRPVVAGDPFSTDIRQQGRANRKPGDPLGVRDIDGSYKTGAMSVVGNPFNESAGLRRLAEDADIRAGRTKPRDAALDPETLRADLAKVGMQVEGAKDVARINAGGRLSAARIAAAGAGDKALADKRKQFETALATRLPDYEDDAERTNANRDQRGVLLDYFDRSAAAGSPATLSEAKDALDLSAKTQEIAARNASAFGDVGSHIVEFLTPDFAYRANEGEPAADPDTALKELDSFIKAVGDPKATSYTFRGTEVPVDPGFFSNLFNEYPDARDKQKALSLLNKRRRALAAQLQASTAAESDEDEDGDDE